MYVFLLLINQSFLHNLQPLQDRSLHPRRKKKEPSLLPLRNCPGFLMLRCFVICNLALPQRSRKNGGLIGLPLSPAPSNCWEPWWTTRNGAYRGKEYRTAKAAPFPKSMGSAAWSFWAFMITTVLLFGVRKMKDWIYQQKNIHQMYWYNWLSYFI
jgi:hypothetical protein